MDTAAALRAAEELVAALKANQNPSPGQHLELLKLSGKVTAALEQPYDIVTKFVEYTSTTGALYTLYHLGAWDKIPVGSIITASELASALNIDISAVQRLLRVAAVSGFFSEPEPDTYTHNELSLIFGPQALGGVFLVSSDFGKSFFSLPDYFKSHKPEDLYDLKKSPFAYALGKEGKTYYDVIDEDVEMRGIWNSTLAAMEKNMPIWGMFPWETLKEQVEKEPERPFVVDIGGGKGQALVKLQQEIPGAFGGKLVLQDLPSVIDTLKEDEVPGIEKMVYDAFTPQPVKNAHVYFMRRFLHDFYNDVCIQFVKNTAQAMGPDSRLIITDMLIPEKVEVGQLKDLYWLDFNLMSMSGKEKTLKEFNEIFDAAGLELVKVWPSGIGATVQIEARLKR
ncbi:hypothetical protein OQA88_6143 [Cercophora sp. LCS_1]